MFEDSEVSKPKGKRGCVGLLAICNTPKCIHVI
ncbi:hypothetical protein BSP101_0079 [Salmonella phage BSP101]|uniref:Uncharacterized protein n=1 Tax=Salmonella phage BSP101 TaxID=1958914 RepID=A0A2P0QE21_9CAUD|nr:hypothetical protein HYP09_gp209 [Salmonella phage BSP101]ARM69916.1 hypothetical protein BSP101_0079 [Salmonella phage BSP101]